MLNFMLFLGTRWRLFFLLLAILSSFPSPFLYAGGAFPSKSSSRKEIKTVTITSENGVKKFDRATLQTVGGINVLHVKGNPYQMAFQHGVLMQSKIQQGMLTHFPRLFKRILDENSFLNRHVPMFLKLSTIADWFVLKPIREQIPEVYRQEIQGLSDGSGLDEDLIYSAYSIPDAFLVVVQLLYNHNLLTQIPLWGCSSFAVWGAATKGGNLHIHGRNLDYSGMGVFDQQPTLIFFEPDKGHGYRYVSATSAGVHTGGITAINEHGLALGLHSILSSDVSVDGGVPIMMIGDQIMRRAKTIEEAVAIVKEFKRIGSWTFFLSHYKSGTVKSGIVEVTNSSVKFSAPKQTHFNITNFFTTPAMNATELKINFSIVQGYQERYKRMNDLLVQNNGAHDVDVAMKILADHLDPATTLGSKERGASPNLITSPDNIQSVIFSAAPGTESAESKDKEVEIWVSAGEVPTAHGPYVRFKFHQGFEDKPLGQSVVTKEVPGIKEAKWAPAMKRYINAYALLSEKGDVEGALEELKKAVELDESDGGYHLMLGMLAFKLERIELAQTHLQKAAHPEPDMLITEHQKNLAKFFLAGLYEVQGNKNEALNTYKLMLTQPNLDDKIKIVALERLNHQESPIDLAMLMPDLKYMDALTYFLSQKAISEVKASIPGLPKKLKQFKK
ncbi:MAG: hypothetical protein HY391_03210 [Deltaproteobacteria bacterium]|nr:hypothetical protein [Deltaproteobacteria bacterium]